MKSNLKKLAWIVTGALIGSSILIFLLWLAHITGLTAGDDGNAISVLGGIMGAIFTAGGIIVALVAVLSQIQLQDRVKQEINGARQELKEEFNNVLRQKFEQEIHKQVDGLLSFFQATNVADWEQAEKLISQAIQFYPDLRKARQYLGIRIAQQIESYFSSLFSQTSDYILTNFDSDLTPISLGAQYLQKSPPVPNSRAIHWLEEALLHNEDTDHQVSLHLALMYSYDGDYTRMLERLEVLKDDQVALDYLRIPHHLIMLLYACLGDESSIRDLVQEIGYTLLDRERIKEAVKTAPFSASVGVRCIDWYALERGQVRVAQIPVRIRLFPPNKDGETYANIHAERKPPQAVPPGTNPNTGGQNLKQLDNLIQELFEAYLFVCPVDGV